MEKGCGPLMSALYHVQGTTTALMSSACENNLWGPCAVVKPTTVVDLIRGQELRLGYPLVSSAILFYASHSNISVKCLMCDPLIFPLSEQLFLQPFRERPPPPSFPSPPFHL